MDGHIVWSGGNGGEDLPVKGKRHTGNFGRESGQKFVIATMAMPQTMPGKIEGKTGNQNKIGLAGRYPRSIGRRFLNAMGTGDERHFRGHTVQCQLPTGCNAGQVNQKIMLPAVRVYGVRRRLGNGGAIERGTPDVLPRGMPEQLRKKSVRGGVAPGGRRLNTMPPAKLPHAVAQKRLFGKEGTGLLHDESLTKANAPDNATPRKRPG